MSSNQIQSSWEFLKTFIVGGQKGNTPKWAIIL
jgi:hypothetical protein